MTNQLPPREKSRSEITLEVSEDDTRSALWLGHKWTKRFIWGGGVGVLSLLATLAGMWGDAQLEATRGMREDIQRYTAEMRGRITTNETRGTQLAIQAAGNEAALNSLTSRVTSLETKFDALQQFSWSEAMGLWQQNQSRPKPRPTRPRPHEAIEPDPPDLPDPTGP